MRLRALIVIAFALLPATALAACGGDGDGGPATKAGGPRATLERTFGESATSIDSARLDAALKLDPEGLLKLGGPIALNIKGPFAAPTASTPSRFDLALRATLGGQEFEGRALSNATHSYLRLDDKTYALGARSHPPANAAD